MTEKLDPTSENENVKRWLQQLWLNTGWLGIRWLVATVPGIVTPETIPDIPDKTGSNTPALDTDDLLEKYVEIYQRRITQKVLISAVIDEPNFQPIDFLEIGLKQSSAICRISMYFSHEDLTITIKGFHESLILNERFKVFNEKLNSQKELKAIFPLYSDVIDEIFKNRNNISFLEDLKILSNEENINKLSRINPIPIGTGFLVGGNHLLTNHHVIPNEKLARQCIAQFYSSRNNRLGNTSDFLEYSFNPDDLFISNATLDYSLIQLGSSQSKRPPGYELGWIDLIEYENIIAPVLTDQQTQQLINILIKKGFTNDQLEEQGLVEGRGDIPGDLVTIIQHPRGKKKQQIVLNDNRVTGLSWRDLDYRADTEYGSSGSPVFNMNWELVALTKKVVPQENNIISQDEDVANTQNAATTSEDNPPQAPFKISASRGTRICRIIEDLKYQSNNNPKLRNFIEDFVVTAEKLNYPPLPAALEFDGVSSYVNLTRQQDSIPIAFATAHIQGSVSTKNAETKVILWSVDSSEIASVSIRTLYPVDLSFSPDGKWLVIGLDTGYGGIIEVWELDKILGGSQQPLSSWIADDYGVHRLSVSPNSKILAASSGMSPVLTLWNIPDGSLIKNIEKSNSDQTWWFRGHNFSSDGKFLATGGTENLAVGKIGIWNLDTGELLDSKTAHGDMVWTVSFSPDNKLLASGGRDGKVGLWKWNGDTLEHLQDLEGHTNEVWTVNFSPDGKIIASASADKTVKLWSKDQQRQWQLLNTLTGHTDQVKRIDFNADNQTLASASEDNTVKIWHITSGQLLNNSNKLNFENPPQVSFNPLINSNRQLLNAESTKNYYSFGGKQPFSLEAWINPVSVGIGGVIISKARGLDQGEYILYITKEGNVVFSRFLDKGTEIKEFLLKTQKLVVLFGKLNHIVATYDGHLMRVYVNGKEDERIKLDDNKKPVKDPQTGKIIFEKNTYAAHEQNSAPYLPLLLGASLRKQRSGLVDSRETRIASNFFKGVITEVRIWNKALKETTIKSNMYRRLNGKDEKLHQKHLIGYWKFEEGDKSSEEIDNVNNFMANAPKGLIFGVKRLAASSFTALPLPFGLLFDGENNYIECAHSKELSLTEAITVEAWVKHKFGDGLIVSKGGFGEESGYCLFWHQGRIRVELQDTQRQEKTIIDTQDYAPDDSLWHHIAFTWNRKSQEIDIYIDAQRQDIISVVSGHSKSRLIDGSYKNVGVFKGPIGTSDLALNIGGRQNHGYYFNGAIAEVRLWNTARSQGEIKVNMARRLDKEELNSSKLVGYWRLDDGWENDTRVHNSKSETDDGEIKGDEVRWFPEPPSLTQDADLPTSKT
ncbi:MAG: hypothetical protein F6J96_10545 [Symploca sp. SIO1C2]|nr:hypothetical protein [Symploca sp. SIO1C2]